MRLRPPQEISYSSSGRVCEFQRKKGSVLMKPKDFPLGVSIGIEGEDFEFWVLGLGFWVLVGRKELVMGGFIW